MQDICHRCGSTVSRQDGFCPVCGAPQLHFDSSDQVALDENADTPGSAGRPGQVNWKVVLSGCARFAIPAGILCGLPLVSAGALLWVVGAASAIILYYRRKRPMAVLSTRSGLRIGALTGFVTAYVSLLLSALLRVIVRFPMHNAGSIDNEYEQYIHSVASNMQTTPETQAQLSAYFHFLLTPDGRATLSLMYIALVAVVTILIASVGGAVGVRMFAGRRVA